MLRISQKRHLKCHGIKRNIRKGKAYIPLHLNPGFLITVVSVDEA